MANECGWSCRSIGIFSKAAQAVENIKNSKGAMDKFVTEMATRTKNKIAEFKSTIDGVKITIGENLASVAIDFMDNWIKKLMKQQMQDRLEYLF